MYERINQRISVVAVFGDTYKDVRPFKIKWNGREYLISAVNYIHKRKEGQTFLYIFSATDGVNFFELEFDTLEMNWRMGRVADNEAD